MMARRISRVAQRLTSPRARPAQTFPQHQQAQVQGLIEVAFLVAIAAAVPVWSYFLYDEHAHEETRQALPFFVGACLTAGAAALAYLMPKDASDSEPATAALQVELQRMGVTPRGGSGGSAAASGPAQPGGDAAV